MMSNVWVQSIKFGVVGIANTAFGLLVIYAVMFMTGGSLVLSNLIGYLFGTLFGFALNRSWTFQSDQPASRTLPKYVIVFLVSYLMNLGAVLAVIHFLSVNPYLAQPIGIVVYTAAMFIGSRLFVFRSPKI